MCVGGGGGGVGGGGGGGGCVCVWILSIANLWRRRFNQSISGQSIYFRTFFFAKIIVATTEATSMKTVPNESKLIYAIKFLIVASWCLL